MSGKAQSRRDPPAETEELLRMARERLQRNNHFALHDNCVRISKEGQRLVLTGQVPSFYLKSLLQNLLLDLPGIQRVDNRVDVVACDGLSSTQEQGGGI